MCPPATPRRLIRAISSKSAFRASRPPEAPGPERSSARPTTILSAGAASPAHPQTQKKAASDAIHLVRHPFLIATLMFYHYPETSSAVFGNPNTLDNGWPDACQTKRKTNRRACVSLPRSAESSESASWGGTSGRKENSPGAGRKTPTGYGCRRPCSSRPGRRPSGCVIPPSSSGFPPWPPWPTRPWTPYWPNGRGSAITAARGTCTAPPERY